MLVHIEISDLDVNLCSARHAFFKKIDIGELLPLEVRDAKDVLDVGTGAGDWVLYEATKFSG